MEDSTLITHSYKSADGQETITIRTNDKSIDQEMRTYALGVLPSAKKFPDDQGGLAHSETVNAAPVCPTHSKIMTRKSGPYGEFWSCGSKNVDGTWCKYRPKETV